MLIKIQKSEKQGRNLLYKEYFRGSSDERR